MNKLILQNLNSLLSHNKKRLAGVTLSMLLEEEINNDTIVYRTDTGHNSNIYSEKEIDLLKEAKANSELNDVFLAAVNISEPTESIIDDLSKSLQLSFEEVKNHLNQSGSSHSLQLLFLEYDYEPVSYLIGFSEGDYPLLSEPNYFQYHKAIELFAGIGAIDYTAIWYNLEVFLEKLAELHIRDVIWDSDRIQSLINCYIYQTYRTLHGVFDRLSSSLFDGIPITFPLYIYGNEHDCEPINIYSVNPSQKK